MYHSKRFQDGRRCQNWVIEASVMLALVAAMGLPSPGQTPVSSAGSPVASGPRVEPIVSMRDKPGAGATAIAPHKASYDFTLKDSEWMDTGVVLGAGETANFMATGSFTLADTRVATPDGLERGWKDLLRQFPLNQAKVGALIGRVSDMGASVPFSIGANGRVAMPTSGKLYFRVNVSDDLTGTGSFTVKMTFAPVAKAATASASVAAISTVVTPGTFADIPRRVSDAADGPANEGDMVNFALVGTKEQVEAAYKAAGWVAVDKNVQDAVVNGLMRTLNREAYTEVPMSTLYLFGRPQDMSYARADPLMVAAERHHLRIWMTDKTLAGKPLWVGSSTHDIGFEKDQRNGKVTHKIDPQIDKERDFLLDSFDAAGVFSSAAYVTPTDPLTTARTATGGSFFSDGRIVVMALK
jgi:LssY C-terminus